MGFSYVSVASPRTWGITATPVSNPDMPSASFGKTSSATPTMASGEECSRVMASVQSPTLTGWVRISQAEVARTTTLRNRYVATSTTAMPIASRNPLRKTAARAVTRTRVIHTFSPCIQLGAKGFSTTCAEASAADSVIVIMKSVAANPSSTSTKSFPAHQGSRRSSMAIEPSPCGLSLATLR